MKKLLLNSFLTSFFLLALSAHSQSFLDMFPDECANANDRDPLPGHILRVGFVASTDAGWSFFFPDQRITQNLQMVSIIENAGLIGLGYDALPDLQFRTPAGSFVVAQIFVGDEQGEPLVTCLSHPILLTKFVPKYYGPANAWLDRDSFGYWLKWRKYSRWKWRDRWQKDIFDIRSNYLKYKKRYKSDKKWRDRPSNGRGGWKKGNTNDRDKDKRKDNERKGGWKRGSTNKPKDGQVGIGIVDDANKMPAKDRKTIRYNDGRNRNNQKNQEKNKARKKPANRKERAKPEVGVQTIRE
jgi:hypothetical protein